MFHLLHIVNTGTRFDYLPASKSVVEILVLVELERCVLSRVDDFSFLLLVPRLIIVFRSI